jgi:hypothetical protein
MFFISDELKKKKIVNSHEYILLFLSEFKINTFGDLKKDYFRLFKNDYPFEFWSLIRIFGLLGVEFHGSLGKYNIPTNGNSYLHYIGHLSEEEGLSLSPNIQNAIGNILNSYGLLRISDFEGISFSGLVSVLEQHNLLNITEKLKVELINFSFYIGDFNKGDLSDTTTTEIFIDGRIIKINKANLEKIIVINDTGLSIVDTHLRNDNIILYKDLPPFLDDYLSSCNGVGKGKITKFANFLESVAVHEINFGPVDDSLDNSIYLDGNTFLIPERYLTVEIMLPNSSLKVINEHFLQDNIIYYEDLPYNLDEYLYKKPQIGKVKIKLLLNWFNFIFSNQEITHFVYIDNNYIAIHKSNFEKEIIIPDYNLQTFQNHFIEDNIKYYKDLPNNLDDYVLSKPGLGKRATKKIATFLKENVQHEILPDFWFGKLLETVDKIIGNEEVSFLEGNKVEHFRFRFNLFQGGSKTLEETGNEFGLTRERVRQTIREVISRLFQYSSIFWKDLEKQINNVGYISEEDVLKLYNYKYSLTLTQRNFLGIIMEELKLSFTFDPLLRIFHNCTAEELEQKRKKISKWFDEQFTLSHAIEYSTMNLKRKEWETEKSNYPLLKIGEEVYSEVCLEGRTMIFPKAAKRHLAYRLFCMRFQDGLFLPRDYKRMANEIESEFPNIFDSLTDRTITSYIFPFALLWGRGFYIPKESFNIKKDKLIPIMEWIKEHFEETDVPEINLHLAFIEFEKYLKEFEITNEYALYSALKMHDEKLFYFKKAPNIRYMKNLTLEDMTQTEQLESYFKDAGKKVNRNEAKNYFMTQLGWKHYGFEQRLLNDCENIIFYDEEHMIHIEHVDTNEKGLEMIKNWLISELQKIKEPVPIGIIRPSLLKLAKVSSNIQLFNLLRYYYSEFFHFFHYPFIELKDEQQTENVSFSKQLEKYLLDKNEIAYMSELKKEFLPKGWSEQQLSLRLSMSKEVYPIVKGRNACYAHSETIGINNFVVKEVLSIIDKYYFDEIEAKNEFMLSIDETLLDYLKSKNLLPELNYSFTWTPDLLSTVLRFSEVFFTVGIRDKALFRKGNKYGITDAVSAIYIILKIHFKGATTITSLFEYLKSTGIMSEKMFEHFKNSENDSAIPYKNDGLIMSISEENLLISIDK